MNSSSILNMCLVLSILGLAVDASANLINCNKASAKWFEPVSECDEGSVEFRNGLFSFAVPNSNTGWGTNDSFLLTKDDLNSIQFVIGSITGNQLTGLCVDNSECQKSGESLIRHYPGGATVRVSEPESILLVILGLLGLGLVRRRLR